MLTKDEIRKMTFFFCNLADGDCPKKDSCKRWQLIKDNPFDDYQNYSGRLWNVCKNNGCKLFMKMDAEPPKE